MKLPHAATLDRLLRIAPGAAMLAVLVVGGTLAAQWFWYFAAPSAASSPPAPEPIQVVAAAENVAAASLFGAAPSGGMALSGLNIRLKGVFAGTPASRGVAIVNAGGLTHTSVALRDALLAVQRPFIEVHLSDPSTREPFRQVNFLHDIALESIVGLGARGYGLALESIARREGDVEGGS